MNAVTIQSNIGKDSSTNLTPIPASFKKRKICLQKLNRQKNKYKPISNRLFYDCREKKTCFKRRYNKLLSQVINMYRNY